MRVIGTAGHVDHGKSTLVAALTGVHPDRLKEEQAREMTIELGFAWFTLPDGEEIGIVDVPGHRDFIENMLAGVGGIDAVLFVVAADEGVMPQTREHLAILDLLQVKTGVVVLTKIDLAPDPDWLDLVEADVRSVLMGTVLAGAPLVRVSSRTGTGIPELLQTLSNLLAGTSPRPDLGRPRLPVDRVFTISGFGTVVTGTLSDGRLQSGDEIEILPAGIHGRIRGLQTHRRKEDWAVQGSRTAVNVSGIDVEQIARGDVLARPGQYRPTQRVDVFFRLLLDAAGPLRHSSEVKFFIGASEVLARVRVLGAEELIPGQEGWLQLELQRPIVAVRADRFILRRPSPGETIGGGEIIDPHPDQRHKRFSPELLKKLEDLRRGSPADVYFQAALGIGPADAQALSARAHLTDTQVTSALAELISSGQLIALDAGSNPVYIAYPTWSSITQKAVEETGRYHTAFPLRAGIPREELKSRLKIQPPGSATRFFNLFLKRWIQTGILVEHEAVLSLPEHSVQLNSHQQATANRLLERFAGSPFAPPSIKECQTEVGEELLAAMIDLGWLVAVSAEVVFRRQEYDALVEWVRGYFSRNETLTVVQFRDTFKTSRRYALAFLEHLDAIGLTIRTEDARQLKNKSNKSGT
jgi:selenocysteine-specific elongation factor